MRVKRRPVTDILTREGVTAVLVDGGVVRLSALSAAIFELAEVQIDVDVIAAELAQRFGVPEGRSALEATKDAVADLVHHGVLKTF